MKKGNEKKNTRDHADFQDAYRRSSNFGGLHKDENDSLNIAGEGKITLTDDKGDDDIEIINDVLKDISEKK